MSSNAPMDAGAAGVAPAPNLAQARYESAEARDDVRSEHELSDIEEDQAVPSGSEGGTAVDQGDRHEVLKPSANSSFVGELEDRHVSVRRGKEEFAALERKYSNLSQNSAEATPVGGGLLRRTSTALSFRSARSGAALGGRPQRTITQQSAKTEAMSAADVEKTAGAADESEFNLADELRAGRQAADEANIAHKNVGVVWEDLEVIGAGGMRMNIRNFSNAIIEQVMMPVIKVMSLVGKNPFAPKPKTILHKNSGVLRPGEMCLVLGRPGSGCSTFLKSIANQRDTYLGVNGNVEYAGIDWKEMQKLYAGEVLYNQEDDDHLPTLTVAQTLRFALRLKSPKKLIPGVTLQQYREDLLNLLLSMLNIKHTANTIIGNAFIRGVSGGERKRVSIAEQFCSGAALSSWDNSTRGLDASTALDYAKGLRLLTDIMKQTTFVSLYQAGEGIYQQFEKVILLNEGHVVYFGPASEARAYMVSLGFMDLPRQTTADYLSGCTDPNERRFQEGRDESNVPSTPEQMEEAYRKSEICARMMAEKDAYKQQMQAEEKDREMFRLAVREQKHRGVGKKSPYTVSFLAQVMALTQRQTILKFQNKFDIFSSFATSITIALIVGSVYFRLPYTGEYLR